MSEHVLTKMEKDSATWQKLKAHLADRLQKLRIRNDKQMPEEDRNRLIGQIEEVKHLLSLENEAPIVQDDRFAHLD